jgi:hypothetical protein
VDQYETISNDGALRRGGLALAGSSAVAQITNAPVGTMAKPDQNFMNEAADQIFHRPGPP